MGGAWVVEKETYLKSLQVQQRQKLHMSRFKRDRTRFQISPISAAHSENQEIQSSLETTATLMTFKWRYPETERKLLCISFSSHSLLFLVSSTLLLLFVFSPVRRLTGASDLCLPLPFLSRFLPFFSATTHSNNDIDQGMSDQKDNKHLLVMKAAG